MSKAFMLPSGKFATRFWSHGEFHWQLPTLAGQDWCTLDAADVRALYDEMRETTREESDDE